MKLFKIFRKILLIPIFTKREHAMTDISFVKSTPVVHFTTGGLGLFYQLGVTKYILENYNFDKNVHYSGISAGSYCALLCSIDAKSKEMDNIVDTFFDLSKNLEDDEFWKSVQNNARTAVQRIYTTPRTPKNLHIGVTSILPKPKRNYLENFEDINDALEACIASSHVPLLCGSLSVKYKDEHLCDGGFAGKYDTPRDYYKVIDIDANMFYPTIMKDGQAFVWDPNVFFNLYDRGYTDARNHSSYFDEKFMEITNKVPGARVLKTLSLL